MQKKNPGEKNIREQRSKKIQTVRGGGMPGNWGGGQRQKKNKKEKRTKNALGGKKLTAGREDVH